MADINQSVKCIKTLIHTNNVTVAEFEMLPGAIGERHYHSKVSEYCICLIGQLHIKTEDEVVHVLSEGNMITIEANSPNQLLNPTTSVCKYDVIQSGGSYDFIT